MADADADADAGAAPAPTQPPGSHVSARVAAAMPTGLVPVAVLLAAGVGLLALLPSLAQAVWEVPHLLLLGLVISYGVFAQRNTTDGGAADRADDGKGGAALAWSARYRPDDALVVVAGHAALPSEDGGQQGASWERPLSLPVRRLKPAAPVPESETVTDGSDGLGEVDTDSSASSSGFWAGARAVPSPPSVLDDADDQQQMDLSSCSQPQSPPSFVQSASKSHRRPNPATPPSPTVSRAFQDQGYHASPVAHDQPCSDEGEVTDWDDDEDDADGSDEMTVSSERSARGGDFTAACANDHDDGEGDDDTSSVDEELLKLAAKAGPDGEEEVDRKADEFIAKFREQIRLQRH